MNKNLELMNTLKNDQSQLVKPLVCVRSITYNHAPYILDAMNGFCMQKTSFPFVCAVIDDCSTDGEQEVISNYLHEHFDLEDQSVARYEETDDYKLIYARHKENHNCFFVVLYLKYNHYSIGKGHLKNQYIKEWYDSAKYIAPCEGDDYWIDPLKLQKQVDVMEKHPECTMCCSNGFSFSEILKTNTIINPIPVEKSRFLSTHEVLLEENALIPTCSMCYRHELLDSMPSIFKNLPVGDRPIRMWCAINGYLYYHQEPLITYRFGAVECYTQRVKKNNDYAKRVLNGMLVFFNNFDEYTKYKYHSEVEYMKNRERYVYFQNTANFKGIITAKHLNTYSFCKRNMIRLKCLVKLIPGVYVVYKRLNS